MNSYAGECFTPHLMLLVKMSAASAVSISNFMSGKSCRSCRHNLSFYVAFM